MKRIANYLIVMALAVLTFTSCEDIPSPFGQIVAPKTDDGVVIEPSGKGTLADPYNVAGALEFIAGLGADVQSPTDVYIKGYVTTITEAFGTQYGNATFEISDTKEGANKFLCYRVKYFGGQGYSDPSATNIKEGDEVIICGKVVNYKGNTPETVSNAAYVYSINGKGGGTTPDPGGDTGDTKGKGTQDDPFNIAAAIKKCQEVGETASTEKYYIKGIVVKGGTVSGGYGNLTFTLGDTKDATDVFTAFQVAGTDGEKLADGYKVPAGAEVVVYGPVLNYKGNTPETAGKSAAQIVTVNGKKTNEGGDNPPAGGNDGSLEKPFTPAEANAFIATLAADTNTDKDYYIKGKIIEITDKNQFSTQYGNCTFYISDDGTDKDDKFYVFRTLYLENVKYSDDSWTKPAAKDEVIICGKLVNYKGNTPETVANQSYIYSLNGKTKADSGSTATKGTLENPFTPEEANAFVATLAADTNTETDYYIKGKIIEITEKNQFSTQYGNCTFYLSDDGTDKDAKFYVFRTLYLENVKYSDDSWTKPAAKDEVIICGKLVNYKGNTPETVANQSYIYSLNGKTKK
jgi:trehalose-6-phosphatase